MKPVQGIVFKSPSRSAEKKANCKSVRRETTESDGDHGVAFIGFLLAQREGFLRKQIRSHSRRQQACCTSVSVSTTVVDHSCLPVFVLS